METSRGCNIELQVGACVRLRRVVPVVAVMVRRLSIVGQDGPAPSGGPVFWQTAFRPFFFFGAIFGAAFAILWMLLLSGIAAWPLPLPPFIWHGHEMIYGFALAIVAGFLLTATQVWTSRPTVGGPMLMLIATHWIVARVAASAGASVPELGAALNISFPIVVAVAIGRPIVLAGSTRNLPFVGLLGLLAAADGAIWGETLGFWDGVASAALWIALDAVSIMIVVFGGRIIPMFTKNATGAEIRAPNLWDVVAPASLVALMLAHLPGVSAPITAVVACVAGLSNLIRLRGWGGRRALRVPFVGVLHAGYALVALGISFEGVAPWVGLEGLNPGRHVVAIGGIALMSLGMMSRVALGHTGRPLHPGASVRYLYGLLLLATVARLVASFDASNAYGWWWATAALFALAFVGFAVSYAGILTSPRADGKPG